MADDSSPTPTPLFFFFFCVCVCVCVCVCGYCCWYSCCLLVWFVVVFPEGTRVSDMQPRPSPPFQWHSFRQLASTEMELVGTHNTWRRAPTKMAAVYRTSRPAPWILTDILWRPTHASKLPRINPNAPLAAAPFWYLANLPSLNPR